MPSPRSRGEPVATWGPSPGFRELKWLKPVYVGDTITYDLASLLGLPDDPTAMNLEELDRLIAYHDALHTRYEEAVTRLDAVRDQIEATLREHGGEVVGDLRGTAAAPLHATWIDALAEYTSCRREVEAIGAYAEPLLEAEGG